MFGRFIKPKWKHSNPTIRRTAVAQLDDQSALLEIARHDPDLEVRLAAISRIDNIEQLMSIAICPDIQAALDARFVDLLPAALEKGPDLAAIERHVTSRGGPQLQTTILNSNHLALRKWLVPRLTDAALLCHAITNDSSPEVRRLAAERLEDPETIRAALKGLGKKDKRATHLLKDRLASLEKAAAHEAQLGKTIEEVEALGNDAHWQRDHTRLLSIQNQWPADGAPDTLQARFNDACIEAQKRIDAQREAALSLQPVADAKTSQCELAEQFIQHLRQRRRLPPTEAQELNETLDALLKDWNELDVLPEQMEMPLANRFHAQISEARRIIDTLLDNTRQSKSLEQVIDMGEKLLKHTIIREHQVKDFESRWEQQTMPRDRELAEEYRSHFSRLQNQLQHRLDIQAKKREEGLRKIETLLERIETNLAEDRLRDSDELEKDIRKTLDQLPDIPEKQHAQIHQRLHDLSPRIRELDGWRHWGTDRAREELIIEAEQLIETQQTPQQRAKAVTELRNRWKKLVEIDHGTNHRLWKRFDKACNAAWEICAEHRRQEAEQQQKNLADRAAICEALEKLATEAEQDSPDWRQLDRRFQKLRNEWRDAGPVQRREWQTIQQRFRHAVDAVNKQFNPERERNRALRIALIERLEALQDSEDLTVALDEAKRIQKEWRITVQSRRGEEQKLWQRFKSAGDALFARDKQQRDAQSAEQNERYEKMRSVCEALEQLAETPEKISAKRPSLEQAWHGITPPRSRQSHELQQRYQNALGNLDFALERLALEQQLETLESCNADDTTEVENDSLNQHLLDLEILLDIDSPANIESARMERKVAMLSERLNDHSGTENDNAFSQALAALESLCASKPAMTSEQHQRFEKIRDAAIGELSIRIAELRQLS